MFEKKSAFILFYFTFYDAHNTLGYTTSIELLLMSYELITDFEVNDRRLKEELTNYVRVWTDEGCHERCPVNIRGFQLNMGTSQTQT